MDGRTDANLRSNRDTHSLNHHPNLAPPKIPQDALLATTMREWSSRVLSPHLYLRRIRRRELSYRPSHDHSSGGHGDTEDGQEGPDQGFCLVKVHWESRERSVAR